MDLATSFHHHQVLYTLASYYVLSSAISTLPSPKSDGFYRWFFDFSHLLAANVSRVVATRYQAQIQQLGLNSAPVTNSGNVAANQQDLQKTN